MKKAKWYYCIKFTIGWTELISDAKTKDECKRKAIKYFKAYNQGLWESAFLNSTIIPESQASKYKVKQQISAYDNWFNS